MKRKAIDELIKWKNLDATDEPLYSYYQTITKEQQIEGIFHNRLTEAYNYYLIIGGMHECVSSWFNHKDPARATQIQKELVQIYENDFSKYNGKVNSGRILMVFRSIVTQLAKFNEKFMYDAVRVGEHRDASGTGGRTHVAMSYSLGLWFEKNDTVF